MAEKLSSEDESEDESADELYRRLLGLTAEDLERIKKLGLTDEEKQRSVEKECKEGIRQSLQRLIELEEVNELEEEVVYGPYAYELYRKVLENGEEEDSSIRVNVVGNFGQGKTSLVARLLGKDIRGLESTNGIEISRFKCQQDASGNIRYEENPELNPSVVSKRIVTAAGPIENKQKHPRPKSDKPKKMSKEESKNLIMLLKKADDKTSDSDSMRLLDFWDFGGQYVFYATHTMFHSRKAVYLLVFNLTCGLKDTVKNGEEECCVDLEERTMEYYIRFWVNSIHSFVGSRDGMKPKIILVGTHKEQLKGDAKSKQKQADKYFDDIRALFRGKPALNHIFHEDFALDNKEFDNVSFDSLRNAIHSAGEEYSKLIRKPAKWIKLEQSLFDKKREEIIEFTELIQIDSENEYPLRSEEQIKLFLQHQHDQGTLFYFDEEQKSQHVVLDPKFLVDAFKCLITADRFVRNAVDVYEDWQKLSKEGKLENHLIEKLWGSANAKFITYKNTLLWFLQKHRIISEIMHFDETKQVAVGLGWYVVPSLLKDHSEAVEIKELLKEKRRTQTQFVFSFDDSSIVQTVYHRLTAAVLGKWPVSEFRDKQLLFQNMSVVRIDCQHLGIIEMNDRHIHLYVLNQCPPQTVNSVIPDALRRFAESVILYDFRKFQRDSTEKDLPYQIGYTCNHKSHDMSGKHVKAYSQNDDNDIVPCTENGAHSIYNAAAKAEWYQGHQKLKLVSSDTLSDKTIAQLSKYVGGDWERLAAALTRSQPEIEQTKLDYPNSTVMQIYKILLSWRDEFPEKASLHTLVAEMQKLDITVHWDGIRNIVDEQNKSEQSG